MKRQAFTLAEVLIVLSIIGIVAETTIPILKAKIDKQIYVTQLKKFYETQMDGWSRLLANEGVSLLEDTTVFQKIPNGSCTPISQNYNLCKPFFDELSKIFRGKSMILPDYQIYTLPHSWVEDNLKDKIGFVFSDGSIVVFWPYLWTRAYGGDFREKTTNAGGKMHSYHFTEIVDINGFKKPNIYGRDVFMFAVSGDGKIYPRGGKDYSLYFHGDLSSTWQNNYQECIAYGFGCAGRIMEESWEMNY